MALLWLRTSGKGGAIQSANRRDGVCVMASAASPSRSQHSHDKSRLDSVKPQMLRGPSLVDPQKVGEDTLREIGQALDWAIEQAHTNKGALASDMGYTDQGVIGRWISGKERVQLDKLRVGARKVFVEFLLALLQMEEGVEVKTQVTMRRIV